MAKRRRLSLEPDPILRLNPHAEPPARTPLGTPPIASVAGEAAAASALEDVSNALVSARDEGRLIQRIPLSAIDAAYLVRDRIPVEDEAMENLRASLRARGQQTPVEVADLGQGRYGLISGWRRLTALRQLFDEGQEARFAEVLAVTRAPSDASDAYVAMVEENEIRAGVSFYERARIVKRAVEEGVYPDLKSALNGLFGSVSRAKRSKIKSFVTVVEELDGVLRFPTQIGERLGLGLAKRLADDPTLARELTARLETGAPSNADAEQRLLQPLPSAAAQAVVSADVEVAFDRSHRRITLSGAGVDGSLERALKHWLETFQKQSG